MASKLPILNAADYVTPKGKYGLIGRGAYGRVRLCKNKKSEKFAIKYFLIIGSEKETAEKIKKITTESDILHKLSHPNIIKVDGIIKWKDYIGIVTEYVSNGNLDGFLNNKQLSHIPWVLRLKMAVEISEAINYLHHYKPNKELVHGDIKPENILLDRNLSTKLADFGSVNIAKHTGATATMTDLPINRQHTVFYTPPEFLKDPMKPRTTKMDVFSFGVVLYEFVTGSRPYENATAHPHVLLQVIIDRGQRPDQSRFDEIQNGLSSDDLDIFNLLVELMKKCWAQQPIDRLEIKTVCESLHSTSDRIDDNVIEQHIKNVLEILGKKEKDFDLSQGICLSQLSVDFDENSSFKSTSEFPEIIPSIDEVLKHQKTEKETFLFKVSPNSYEEIQTVFPTLIEVQDYQNELPNKETYEPWPNDVQLNNFEQLKSMSFKELLGKISESEFIGLVGLSGSDITSLCRRLARYSELISLIVPFMNLNYGPDKKLTLRQLLLDYNYPGLSEGTCESSFKWIVENQDKCLIIMDGYDQANWSLVKKAPVVSYIEPQLVWELVSNLCRKCYLPCCHILFTSRPHSMTTVPKSVVPDYVIYVLELSDENMKKLFFAFAGSDADKLWKKLHNEAQPLVKLCSTPIMLQLVLKACKSSGDFTNISTMTRFFKSVLSHLRVSARHDDILKIDGPLAELAYNATNNETVVMKPNDLTEVGLTPTIVQDLVIAEHTYTDGSCKVFEGDETLFFIHQTIQKYLTARHVYYALSQAGFEQFIKDKLFTPHWAMVRQFLYGIAFDLSKSEKVTESIRTRKILLKQRLIEKMDSRPKSTRIHCMQNHTSRSPKGAW